jgi:hypothetical protein
MAISLQCEQCGKQYQLSDNLAGKRIKCKECGNAINVPGAAGAANAAGPIAVACGSCGKQFQVKAELAGKRVKCQQCGTAVQVPAAGAPAAAPAKTAASAAKTAAPQAAAAAQGAGLHGILDEEFAAGAMPTMPTAGQMYCPKCRAIIPANASLCVHCGFKLESGRMITAKSEANKPVRRPGTMTAWGYLAATVGLLYSMANIVIFGAATFGAAVILWKLGLPNDENPQSAIGMFGGPVFLLLFTAGCLLFISSIGIFRKVKGAIPNAALASKIYVGAFILAVILGFSSTLYQKYVAKPKTEGQPTAAKKKETDEPAPTFSGPAAMLLGISLSLALTAAVIIQALLTLAIMIGPPVYILIWANTQGKRLDWEFPEPLYKPKSKSTGISPDITKKPPAPVEKGKKK